MELDRLEIYKGKRVFITGHTGFKGSWLIKILESIGAECFGYAKTPIDKYNHFDLLHLAGESVYGDILESEKLQKAIHLFQPNIIFHLAAQALVRRSYIDPVETYETNVMGTLNVLKAAEKCKSLQAIICITTDKVYENKEWHYPYREEDELGGHDMYSSSKACCEILIKSFRNSFLSVNDYNTKHHVLIATARAGNVIGGGDWSKDRLIPDLIRGVIAGEKVTIRSPHSVRPWQHVMDCLNGYLLLGEKLLLGKEKFATSWNFSPHSYETSSVKKIIQLSQSLWNDIDVEYKTVENGFHEAKLLTLDNSKAVAELGWKPKWNTEKTISETIKWYKLYHLKGIINTNDQIESFFKY